MEYAAGGDLPHHVAALQRDGKWSLSAALQLAAGAAKGLEYAHSLHIWHRDIKPDNVLVAGDGRAMLGDWGQARERMGSSVVSKGMGSPLWMAPEVLSGAEYDSSADIWSLGITVYQVLRAAFPRDNDSNDAAAATSPFAHGGGVASLLRNVLTRDPDLSLLPADTPPDLRAVLGEMLAKEAGARPDAAEVAARLALAAKTLTRHGAGATAGGSCSAGTTGKSLDGLVGR